MFLPEPHNQAVNGGGGNRTRVGCLHVPLVDRDGADSCFYCGCAYQETFQRDHVTPRSHAGPDSLDNLVLSCAPCNYDKGALPGWVYVLLVDRGPIPRSLPRKQAFPIDASAWLRGDWARELHDWAHEQIEARKATA